MSDEVRQRIRWGIKALGVSQSEVARRSSMSPQHLNAYLQGKYQAAKHLPDIAKALEVDLAWLTTGDPTRKPSWIVHVGTILGGKYIPVWEEAAYNAEMAQRRAANPDPMFAAGHQAGAVSAAAALTPQQPDPHADLRSQVERLERDHPHLVKWGFGIIPRIQLALLERAQQSPPAWTGTALGSAPLPPAGSVRAGLADTVSQIEQRAVSWPEGCAYLAVEGDSAGDVLRSGQLAVLAPESTTVREGDIAAIHFRTGPYAGQTVIKWISRHSPGWWQLDSHNIQIKPIMVPDADYQAAEKRKVIGAIYTPGAMVTGDGTQHG